jgi:hypothetical protein
MELLKEEFDLKTYMNDGLVSNYYPIHQYKDRKIITQYWWKMKWKIHFLDLFK